MSCLVLGGCWCSCSCFGCYVGVKLFGANKAPHAFELYFSPFYSNVCCKHVYSLSQLVIREKKIVEESQRKSKRKMSGKKQQVHMLGDGIKSQFSYKEATARCQVTDEEMAALGPPSIRIEMVVIPSMTRRDYEQQLRTPASEIPTDVQHFLMNCLCRPCNKNYLQRLFVVNITEALLLEEMEAARNQPPPTETTTYPVGSFTFYQVKK